MIKEMTEKQAGFIVWIEALSSGNYQQTQSHLCEDVGEGEKAYCCLGVLDEVVLGTSWSNVGDGYVLVDDEGEVELLSTDRVSFLDLDRIITEDERDYFADNDIVVMGDYYDRVSVLAHLNDSGWTFEQIVDTITELGWDND